ncbi:HAMP domain-containing protein, partial [Chloroflexota bacterium]
IKQLAFLFLLTGLVPILLTVILPAWYFHTVKPDALTESLLIIWGVQSAAFVIVVLLGAAVTLNRLVLPIRALSQAAQAIAAGDFAYRVPARGWDDELTDLAASFNEMATSVEEMRNNLDEQHIALQETLDEREREFDVLVEISSLANNQADLANTAERALTSAHSVLKTDIISLLLLDEAQNITSIVYSCKDCPCDHQSHCDACPRQQQLRQCLYAMQDNLIREALDTGKLVPVDDALSPDAGLDPVLQTYLQEFNVRKMGIKPLISRGRALGVMVMMRHYIVEITDRTLALNNTLAETIAVLIENWHHQNQARQLTILEERRRMASELHDSVTQSLFTLSLTARGLKSSLHNVPEVNQQALELLLHQTKVIQTEMRALINELRPYDLDTTNDLGSALRQHVQSLRQLTNSTVKLTIRGNISNIPVSVQQNLNRVAQEALSNVARHAQATAIEIILAVQADTVTLTIIDNGQGFDPRDALLHNSGSFGLISMRERAEMMGGALLIRSQPEAQTTITAQIPLMLEMEPAYAK